MFHAKTTCSPTLIRPNLSTLGTAGLKIVISLSLITRQRKVMTDPALTLACSGLFMLNENSVSVLSASFSYLVEHTLHTCM